MCKRLLAVFLFIGLLVCMSLSSLAAVDLTKPFYADKGYLIDKGDGNTYLGVLDTAALTESEKDWMRDFLEVFTDEKITSSTYCVFLGVGFDGASFYFVKHPTKLDVGYSSDRILVWNRLKPSLDYMRFSFRSSDSVFYLSSFKVDSQFFLHSKSFELHSFPTASVAPNNYVGGLLWSNQSDPMVYEGVPSAALQSTFNGKLTLVDNGGLLPPDEPEEPEEPSSSTPSVPTLPEIPAGDGEYVPYDTSAWLGFLVHILSTMSTAAKVGILIFASLLGILLIIWVIRWFLPSR
ncbi:hypothetical protein ACS3UN_07990 [Oscillospiraceae bacterium LTW-04]|nr:hypothetical protein RBH76_02355 [Oscillospiraceae bacterium MB24-C1]